MKKGNKKIFKEKKLLYECVNLRLNGWSYTSLASYFNCDRDSIEKQCKKYDIEPASTVFTIERIISQVIPPREESRWLDLGDHRICRGRDYKDYPHSKIVNYDLI